MKQYAVFLQMERKPIIAWSLGTGGFVALMGLVFVAMGGSDGLSDLAESYPQEILDALGAQDITTTIGFLQAEFGSFAPLVFGIYLVMFMTKHLAGAEESGSIDHVMARPIPRSTYYWHLIAAASTVYAVILTTAAVMGIIGFIGEATGKEMLGIVGLMVDLIPYGLVFIGLGGLLGSWFHTRGKANAVGAAIVVISFASDLASRLVDQLDWLAYLSPIGYLARSDLARGELDPLYVAVSLGLAALLAVLGWLRHDTKQLYA